jgi:predicted nucleotide-binding protein (sugar kinase/HSP70/actin superfamily)
MKRLFIPSVINMRRPPKSISKSFACPYTQSIPYTLKASIDFEGLGVRVDTPIVFFAYGQERALKNLIAFGRQIGRSKIEIEQAFTIALKAQDTFYRKARQAGSDMLAGLKDGEKVLVIMGRPYNSTDPGTNMNIHKKLADLGIRSIPIDMLPGVEGIEADEDLESMYWGYGQRIMRGARLIREQRSFYPVYLTNFGCGHRFPSLATFFKRAVVINPFCNWIDEHSADAGMIYTIGGFSRQRMGKVEECNDTANAGYCPEIQNKQDTKMTT